MRRIAILGLFIVAGCGNKIADAEQRYAIVKKEGSDAAAICAEGKAVVEAYLAAHDEEVYHRRKVETEIECAAARRNG
jgi:hypothetical protein